jgi:hypothetical protein
MYTVLLIRIELKGGKDRGNRSIKKNNRNKMDIKILIHFCTYYIIYKNVHFFGVF